MGADTSRFYSQAEESIDAYINRGGARLVNRERRLTTSTTIDIGIGGTTQFSVSLIQMHNISCETVRGMFATMPSFSAHGAACKQHPIFCVLGVSRCLS